MDARQLSPSVESYLAFDIGGTKIASGLVTFRQDDTPLVEGAARISTDAVQGGDDVLRRLTGFVQERLEFWQSQGRAVRGIGIGSAGVVDSNEGVIVTATSTMPGWGGQRIYAALSTVTDLPVYMIGDVGAHGLGEALYGAGRGSDTVLSLGIGTGIGGAYIDHGRLQTGAHGVAGHAGHVAHGLGEGFLCSCGTVSGHIEPVASGTGLASLYNRRLAEAAEGTVPANNTGASLQIAETSPVASGREVARRAESGEAFARNILGLSARALGQCIAGMGNLLDPSIIICSGSVANAGDLWWQPLKQGFREAALPLVEATPLVKGTLGDNAPLIGAASAARQTFES